MTGVQTCALPIYALFGDDNARRAILDLRQRLDTAITAQNKLVEDNEQMRRSMLDLQTQIETLRNELAQSRGIQSMRPRVWKRRPVS